MARFVSGSFLSASQAPEYGVTQARRAPTFLIQIAVLSTHGPLRGQAAVAVVPRERTLLISDQRSYDVRQTRFELQSVLWETHPPARNDPVQRRQRPYALFLARHSFGRPLRQNRQPHVPRCEGHRGLARTPSAHEHRPRGTGPWGTAVTDIQKARSRPTDLLSACEAPL